MERKSLVKYFNERANLASDLIENLVKLSDEYHIDRAETIREFLETLLITCEIGTFSRYEVKNEK